MAKSKVFLCLCLAFIGGIFLNSIVNVPQLAMLGFLIFGIMLISVFWRRKKIVVAGFCLLLLVGGAWRHQAAESNIINSELRKYNDLEEKIVLIGKVVKEPDVRDNNIKLTIGNIEFVESWPQQVAGNILATTNRYSEYKYGDKLKIIGELKTPQEFPDFNYKDFLAKDGIYSVVYYPEIELLAEGQESLVYSAILKAKNELRKTVYQNLPPPQSSILGAVILGDKRQISSEWQKKLNLAGVRHLTAISGMHVAILTAVLMSLLLGLGLWRKQAFYLTLLLVASFIIMTGLQASAVRAGIMAGFFLLAQYLGRGNSSSRAIVFAATLMLIQNPFLLTRDVGFQLSFLAIFGIIFFGPVLQGWLKSVPNFFQLQNILVMTLAAQIFTLPILVYNFGYFSLVSLPANILLIPLLPYIMGLGFIFAIAGWVFQPVGLVLSWPVWFLLSYLVKIVDWFSALPFASLSLEISWPWLLVSYIILGVITVRLNQKRELNIFKY